MLVEVTQEDIEQGRRLNCRRCPLALAVSRAAGRPYMVSRTRAWRIGEMLRGSADLPPEAEEWRDRFDSKQPAAPFSFELAIPEKERAA